MNNERKLIIGLSGYIGSGKGKIAKYLEQKGFAYISLSEIVREEARIRGFIDKEFTRELLQNIGDDLRNNFSNSILAERAFKKAQNSESEYVIIDSIRNPNEVKYLKTQNNFFLIGVIAPLKTRFQRMFRRKRSSDPQEWKEFIKADSRDRGIDQPSSGQQVEACIKLADFIIENSFSEIEQLNQKIESILTEVQNKI